MMIFLFDNNTNDKYKFLVWNASSAQFIYKQLKYLEMFQLGIILLLLVDTTQATASNRLKLYLNGSQITSFVQQQIIQHKIR
jgi:hypothetical protein